MIGTSGMRYRRQFPLYGLFRNPQAVSSPGGRLPIILLKIQYRIIKYEYITCELMCMSLWVSMVPPLTGRG